MSEISSLRPWEHLHRESRETEYFIDVHRVGAIEPDEWDFGTDKELRDRVLTLIRQRHAGFVSHGLCNGCGQELFMPTDASV
jgi:hypothetical protein